MAPPKAVTGEGVTGKRCIFIISFIRLAFGGDGKNFPYSITTAVFAVVSTLTVR